MNIPLLIVILYVLLLFCISIYVSYSQKKDSENFLLYKGKNNAFVVAASIAGLAIGGASTTVLEYASYSISARIFHRHCLMAPVFRRQV